MQIRSNQSQQTLRLRPLVMGLALALAPATMVAATAQNPASEKMRSADFAFRTSPILVELSAHKRALGAELSAARAAATQSQMRPAATLPVGHCDDDGSPDSLRSVVAAAIDGDVVDLSALSCSTITLASGGIGVTADNLTLRGPGRDLLTIDGNLDGTVLNHYGAGLLTVEDLTVANGDYFFSGGCVWSGSDIQFERARISDCTTSKYYTNGAGIFSEGDITLVDSELTNNSASSDSYAVYGGGAFSLQDITVSGSTVSGNEVRSDDGAHGGGLFSVGNLTITDSTISDNNVVSYQSRGGGVATAGAATVSGTTISNNSAALGGGAYFFDQDPTGPSTLINSTVSGNMARINGGGVLTSSDLTVANSTVAFNHAADYSGGLAVHQADVSLQSSILAMNTADGGISPDQDVDLSIYSGALLASANNLVTVSSVVLPPDTITADPQLLPLANNGGATPTHALAAASPAIDAGNNAAGLAFDQRGSGFDRVSGGAADIGAYELQAEPEPPAAPVSIPSASTWSLAMLAGLLGLFGWRSGRLQARLRR